MHLENSNFLQRYTGDVLDNVFQRNVIKYNTTVSTTNFSLYLSPYWQNIWTKKWWRPHELMFVRTVTL